MAQGKKLNNVKLGLVQMSTTDNPTGTGLRPQHFQCLRQLVGLALDQTAVHDLAELPGD